MRRLAMFLIVSLTLGISGSALQGQEAACSVYLEQALAAVQDACGATGRNQACYGNFSMQATSREAIILDFDARGDLTSVADLQTLRLDGLNPEANTWGIALMKLQANLPDSLPGENVTFVLFGDVEIENAADPTPTLAVTTGDASNVRQRPSTEAAVIGSLASGETVMANGRTTDSTWLRVRLPDSDALGWVSADLLTPSGEVSSLAPVDPADETVPFEPMQAFYFRSGASGTNCEAAPQDGILIQTPEGVGQISLRANDVDIQLGSTAFLKAQESGSMSFSILEGAGRARVDGEYVEVPAGSWVEIPMSEDLSASGEPSDPKPYNNDALQRVPVQLLPRAITITPSLTEEEIAAFLAARESGD